MQKRERPSLETQAVHGGIGDYEFRPVVPPIYESSTFAFDNADHGAALFAGEERGFIYTRMGNPTVRALEESVAALEGGHDALACGSGMAAIHTTLAGLLRMGDHVICSDAVYGPTCTLIETHLRRFGIESTMVNTADLDAVSAAIGPYTKVIYVETPGNPTLVVTDIEAVSALAHERGAVVVVDNTFLSPMLQQPLKLGADVVVHSLTKFLNGHADVVGGIIVVKDEQRYAAFRGLLNHLGGVLPPLEAFLVHRGLKTLALRMKRHCESAQKVAEHLSSHPAVQWVSYPGLPSHPQYDVAQRQTKGGGGVVSFGLKGGLVAGRKMMDAVRLCTLAVSLGGVETLIEHPASMTHAGMGREARERAHISDGLVRISVGIEDVRDILADIDNALDAATTTTIAKSATRPPRKQEMGATCEAPS